MDLIDISRRVKKAYGKFLDIKEFVEVVPFIFRTTKGYTVWAKTRETLETIAVYEKEAGNQLREIEQSGEYYTMFIKVS